MRITQRFIIALAVLSLLATALAVPALARGRKGHRGGTGTITLVMVDPTDTVVNHGDTITFTVSTTATDRPFVQLDCYQGTTWVSTASAGFFAGYPWSKNFILSSSMWTTGGADCLATLYSTVDGSSTTTLATLPIPVKA